MRTLTNIDGDKFFYEDNKLHREDGPAIIYRNGNREWYYKGELIPVTCQDEFVRYIKLYYFS